VQTSLQTHDRGMPTRHRVAGPVAYTADVILQFSLYNFLGGLLKNGEVLAAMLTLHRKLTDNSNAEYAKGVKVR